MLPFKFRWILLLVASYFFYAWWNLWFLGLIIYSTTVDYFAAQKIETSSKKGRKWWLLISLISNFGLLFVFKYFNFFVGSRSFFQSFADQNEAASWLQDILKYGVPIGISFYTFQTVGYTLDVYFGKAKAEKNWGKFALFVAYFPQLVAGPIERFSRLQKQIFTHYKLSYTNLSHGFRLILYGLFIKMVIADNLAPLSDPVFANPLAYDQESNILALGFFSIQIYADFHGYSLIAIGIARLMGVRLMDNFKAPYLARSIRSFWSRWHISLSTWFRDYLYIPLGGNKVKYLRWSANIMIVFVISGAWHGANFTFIIWGLIHGIAYLLERSISIKESLQKNPLLKFFGWIKTLIIINLAWLFFRSESIAQLYLSWQQMWGAKIQTDTYHQIQSIEHSPHNETIESTLSAPPPIISSLSIDSTLLGLLLGFFLLEWILRKKRFDDWLKDHSFPVRWLIYAMMIYAILALSGTAFFQFIYFQF